MVPERVSVSAYLTALIEWTAAENNRIDQTVLPYTVTQATVTYAV